jgi:hypothetical protein
MLKRIKRDPRPALIGALARQYWMTADQVASITGYPPTFVSAQLRMLWKDGKVERMNGDGNKLVYRRVRAK